MNTTFCSPKSLLARLTLASLCLYLNACASQPPVPSPPLATERHFRCGTTPVSLAVDGATADLSVDGNNFKLSRRSAASGMMWGRGGGDTGVVFWDQGEQAVLKVAMRNYPPCDRVPTPGKP